GGNRTRSGSPEVTRRQVVAMGTPGPPHGETTEFRPLGGGRPLTSPPLDDYLGGILAGVIRGPRAGPNGPFLTLPALLPFSYPRSLAGEPQMWAAPVGHPAGMSIRN